MMKEAEVFEVIKDVAGDGSAHIDKVVGEIRRRGILTNLKTIRNYLERLEHKGLIKVENFRIWVVEQKKSKEFKWWFE